MPNQIKLILSKPQNFLYLYCRNHSNTYRKSVFCMDISESLYVIEHQPRQRYDHQHYECDGDKKNGCPVTRKYKKKQITIRQHCFARHAGSSIWRLHNDAMTSITQKDGKCAKNKRCLLVTRASHLERIDSQSTKRSLFFIYLVKQTR